MGLVEVLGASLAEDVVRGPLWLNVVTVLLTTLPLCVRRRWPLAVVVVIFGAVAGRALVSEPLEIYPPALAGLVAIYSVAAYAPFRQAVAGYVVAVAGIAVAAANGTGGDATPDLLASVILMFTLWAIGLVVARRWSEVRTVAEQAEELHRRREEETRQAVEAERARIARDLHDSVAHSLAMIAIQAGGAASVLERDPQRAAQSLRSIETTARTGLSEMRHLLHLVGEDDEQPRGPQPGLGQITELVTGAEDAGLDVRLTTTGEETPVAPGVGLAAYRIVQEALTNAAKHTPGARPRSPWSGRTTSSPSRWSATVRRPAVHPEPGAASSACASGPRWSVAASRPVLTSPARSACWPFFPRGWAFECASADRRRPGAGAHRPGDDGRRC